MNKEVAAKDELQHEHIFQFDDAKSLSGKIMNAVEKYWQAREYCDLELIVGIQEERVPVHKIILVSFSDYFSGLLNPHMREGTQGSVRCGETLQAASMVKLIQLCYTGKISLDIRTEKIEDLLEAADYLRLKDVCDAISSFLAKNLSDENCMDILRCADHFQLTELRSKAMTYITMNYYQVSQSPDFVACSEMYLIEILQSEKLVVHTDGVMWGPEEQENYVVQSVLRYVDSNITVEKRLPNLLQLLKLPLLSKEKLTQLTTQTRVKDSPECLQIIEQARTTEPTDVDNLDSSPWSRPRNGVRLLLREFHECASGGQVNSEEAKFNCRDILQVSVRAYVTGMKLGIRRWDNRPVLGGLQIFYSTGARISHGIDPSLCEDTHEFHLNSNERITKVDVRNGWMIDSLRCHTNLDNTFGPYGGDGGSEYTDCPPENSYAYLAGVSGSVVMTQGSQGITRLKLMWGLYDASEEQERFKTIQLIAEGDLQLWHRGMYFKEHNQGDIVQLVKNGEHPEGIYVHLRSGELIPVNRSFEYDDAFDSSYEYDNMDDYEQDDLDEYDIEHYEEYPSDMEGEDDYEPGEQIIGASQ